MKIQKKLEVFKKENFQTEQIQQKQRLNSRNMNIYIGQHGGTIYVVEHFSGFAFGTPTKEENHQNLVSKIFKQQLKAVPVRAFVTPSVCRGVATWLENKWSISVEPAPVPWFCWTIEANLLRSGARYEP